jgi:heat shock protein HslJ
MKKVIIILCAVIFIMCVNTCKVRERSLANTDHSDASADLSGVYTGMLPCADCPGIQTKIELKKDATYVMQTKYIDRSEELFTDSGKFRWNVEDRTITLDNSLVSQCLVEGNTLTVLVNGKKTTGELAEYYILRKVDVAMVEKYWKLVELYGHPIAAAAHKEQEAHIIFKIDANRFVGNTGCNRITGSYRTKEPAGIIFSQAAVTQMMCMNMDTENQFLQVLQTADSYVVRNDTLALNGERTTLARFVAVYM